jgi:hypothetical protein
MSYRCLFHVHTRHSFDSLLSPERILLHARKSRIDVLIVTDHNTVQGARDVQAIASGNPKFVLTAAEYQSEKGDIIGLFLKEEIQSRSSKEILREIRSQGGISVLPHPYKAHTLDQELLSAIDIVEIHNSRCSETENSLAKQLALQLDKPTIGGADAHCAGELAAVVNLFSKDVPEDEEVLRQHFMASSRSIESQPVSGIYRPVSQMIKALKTRNPLLFVSQTKRLGVTLIRESLR